MHSLTNGLPFILCKGFPIDLISVSGFNYGRLKIRNGLFTLTQRFDRDQNQYRGRNIQERCDEVQVTHAPSCSLERSERRPARLRCRLDRQSLVVPFLNLEIVGWVLLTRFAISLSDNPKLAIDSINSLVDMSIPVNIHE